MKYETKIEIIESYINGNKSEFNRRVRNMRKIDLLEIIVIMQGQFGIKYHVAINTLRNILEG